MNTSTAFKLNLEKHMKQAIGAARASERREGAAIGAVVVNEKGYSIGAGMSVGTPLNDPTMHAEIMAIRDAANKMNTIDLKNCVIFSTLEPCGMCLSAALWANMKIVFFGAYAEDVKGNEYEFIDFSSEDIAKRSRRWDGSVITVHGGIMRDDCKELMSDYKNWQKVTR